MNKKKWLNAVNLIFLFFGFGIIYYIGNRIGWEKIWEILSRVSWWQLAVILFFPLIPFVFHALGWFFLFDRRKEFKFIHLLKAQISSNAVSEVVPMGQAGGEPYRAYYVKKKYPSEASPNIIASIILYNTIHTIATGILMGAGFMVILSFIDVNFYKKIAFIAALVVGFVLVFYFIQKQKKGMMDKIFSFLGRFKIFQKFVHKKHHKALMIDDRLKQFYHHHRFYFYLGLILILGAKILGALEFFLILQFIDYPVSFSLAFLVFTGNAFVQLALFFIPAQIGAQEGSIYYLFALLGLIPAFGLSLALFRRIRAFFWTLIGLIIGYFWGPGKTPSRKPSHNELH